MPSFPGMPYGAAPSICFPLTEFCMYFLFVFCMMHALKHGTRHVSYLLGGILFGLILEYINVISNLGYTYGKFMIMIGRAPYNIPLCIGVGWGVIMYTARLFSDRLGLPLWSAVALDALLAISIDLSMDAVAYRLHLWHWNWNGTGLNPLTADWFGVPFGNFFGWLMVVFFYSSASRIFERIFLNQQKPVRIKPALVPILSILLSQVFLYLMLVYVDHFLSTQFGITALHRFIAFLVVLIVITIRGLRKMKPLAQTQSFIVWLVPLWFHLYFFTWLFAGGFYKENVWLVFAATLNLVMGVGIHAGIFERKRSSSSLQRQSV